MNKRYDENERFVTTHQLSYGDGNCKRPATTAHLPHKPKVA